jgi:hypothetical protein
MRKGVRSHTKRKAKSSKSMTSIPPRLTLFGQPQLLPGEDAADYDELLARVCAVVKPVDIIDKIFIADVVSLEWEVLRWRRLKSSLLQACGLKALERFLAEHLEYYRYGQHFADDLTKILQDHLPEDEAKDAKRLALQCAQNDPDADEKVKGLLDSIGQDMVHILDGAQARKAKELVSEYARRKPEAITQVNEALSDAGVSIEALIVDALAKKLDDIERIDRLTTVAESRRNAMLHEIDRRRAVLGETLRRSVQEIEHGEVELVETPPVNGKGAA